jgi:ferredoxin
LDRDVIPRRCIGCTNCAMIARNVFQMDEEHGRARAFNQVPPGVSD